MERLRIGLVGAGWVSAHHLDAYRAFGHAVEVVAIADPDSRARENRAAEYGILASFATAAEMLGAARLDAVDVASPREHHAEGVLLAARHGLPVLCQKPLAPTLFEAEALVASLPAGTRLMVHENWRFRPHYRLIARWLAEGRVGRVRQATVKVLTSGLLPDAGGSRPALRRQPMLAGLDRMLLMEVVIHHVDTLRFLLGDLVLRAAILGHDCPEIRGEDRATLLLAAGQAPVVVVADFMTHGAPPTLSDQLEVQGTEGTIRLEGGLVTCLRGGEVVDRHQADLAADYAASYAGAIGHFVESVRSGAPFETGPEDNLRTLALIERAYEEGRPPLPPGG